MIRRLFKIFCVIQFFLIVATTQITFANYDAHIDLLQLAEEDFQYDEYYVIESSAENDKHTISLNQFKKINQKFPLPAIKYNRQKHFGGWIKPVKGQCMNTRALVLTRDSHGPVDSNNNCSVISGDWDDPYTDMSYYKASEIQIDHVVPLKNAYMTGAHNWDNLKRCLYANFLGNKFHLLPVSGHENERKGDRSPREYIPPNKQYTCQYLRNWLEIKYVWKLSLTPLEKNRIDQLIVENNCDDDLFEASDASINQQNQYIQDHKNLCL